MARPGKHIDGLKVARARQRIVVAGKPITQAAFAERLGIHWTTMNRIENGHARVSLELIEQIAQETGEDRDHFLASDEDDAEAAAEMPATAEAEFLEALRPLARLLSAKASA